MPDNMGAVMYFLSALMMPGATKITHRGESRKNCAGWKLLRMSGEHGAGLPFGVLGCGGGLWG